MKYLFWYILFLLMGCNEINKEVKIVFDVNQGKTGDVSEVFEDRKIVFLETLEESLLTEVTKIICAEDRIYILDEPTTGLHFADVHKLVEILHRLTEGGNTVVVIEHNLDVIKTADHIIDIGPEGGDGGGQVIARGTPEEVVENPLSYTGQYIKKMLEKK